MTRRIWTTAHNGAVRRDPVTGSVTPPINAQLLRLHTGINAGFDRRGVAELGLETGGMDTPISIDPATARPWPRFTAHTIEFFRRGERVAVHLRGAGRGRHTTIAEHMSSSHRRYAQWTIERIGREAAAIGPSTAKLAEPSGRSATPAGINRNGRPTSIGTGGRHQSECPAGIIGIRSHFVRAVGYTCLRWFRTILTRGLP